FLLTVRGRAQAAVAGREQGQLFRCRLRACVEKWLGADEAVTPLELLDPAQDAILVRPRSVGCRIKLFVERQQPGYFPLEEVLVDVLDAALQPQDGRADERGTVLPGGADHGVQGVGVVGEPGEDRGQED